MPDIGELWAVQLSNDQWRVLRWERVGERDPSVAGWVHGQGEYDTREHALRCSFPSETDALLERK